MLDFDGSSSRPDIISSDGLQELMSDSFKGS